MEATLSRVGLNEMLDRLLVAARAPADSSLLASCRNNQACLTPELTRREVSRETFNLANDIQADSAPVE
jgi:hypothetical protein